MSNFSSCGTWRGNLLDFILFFLYIRLNLTMDMHLIRPVKSLKGVDSLHAVAFELFPINFHHPQMSTFFSFVSSSSSILQCGFDKMYKSWCSSHIFLSVKDTTKEVETKWCECPTPPFSPSCNVHMNRCLKRYKIANFRKHGEQSYGSQTFFMT